MPVNQKGRELHQLVIKGASVEVNGIVTGVFLK